MSEPGRTDMAARFVTPLEPAGRTLGAAEAAALETVIRSGILNASCGGEWVGRMEDEAKRILQARHAVACSSGTAAIHLGVACVDPEPGDEIVTTPLTDFGTVIPILAQNAVPVFADVDPATGMLDPVAVEAAISERTRAIVAVHLFGWAAPVAELRAIADRYGIMLIEDAAQAYMTIVDDEGSHPGRFGHIACYSLQQYKHVTAGDGGIAVTQNDELAQRMRLFGDKGWPREGGMRTHLLLGLNYRITELQAAVAAVQLARLPDVVARRRAAGRRVTEALAGLEGLRVPPGGDRSSWWMFPLVVDPDLTADNNAWATALQDEGVPASAGWLAEPVYCYPVLRERRTYGGSGFPLTMPPARREWTYGPGLCPHAEELVWRTLVLIPWNENYDEPTLERVADGIRAVHARLASSRRAGGP